MTGIRDTNDGKILENTGDLYVEIATAYPSDNYTQFCNQLGVKYAESKAVLRRNLKDYKQSLIDVLNTWEAEPEEEATRAKLESAMKKAKTGALCRIVAKHFAKDAVHEEDASNEDAVHEEEESGEDEEESDEDAVHEEEESDEDDEESDEDDEESDEDEPSGSRSKRAPKKATQPSQRGSTLNIIASGNAKVKGNSMTGSVINMTTKNYAAGASKSQGQGRKRKATGSKAGPSGGKKRKTKKRR